MTEKNSRDVSNLLKVGDFVFTNYQPSDFVTAGKPYEVVLIHSPNCVSIHDDEGESIPILFSDDDKCAFLDGIGNWYKLEDSITKRHALAERR